MTALTCWVCYATTSSGWPAVSSYLGLLRGHFSARATQKSETAHGSCRSRGRQERAHRSLENRTERGFPQLPQAPSSATKVLPMFPVYSVTYVAGSSPSSKMLL